MEQRGFSLFRYKAFIFNILTPDGTNGTRFSIKIQKGKNIYIFLY